MALLLLLLALLNNCCNWNWIVFWCWANGVNDGIWLAISWADCECGTKLFPICVTDICCTDCDVGTIGDTLFFDDVIVVELLTTISWIPFELLLTASSANI